jgi:regulator of protease activity HflC (stomatin/prohibitin superfamily)
MMKQEKITQPISGYPMLLVEALLLAFMLYGLIVLKNPWFFSVIPLLILIAIGFFIINPNHSKVLVLFGAYKGTAKKNGFFWTNPFYFRKEISLRARNFDSERVKVNDKVGNPILISVIAVWRVEETYKAAFEVDDYEQFVKVQSDAAVRKMAGSYPYDNFDDDQAEITLRSGMNEINDALEDELSERLHIAGIEVMEARIGYLAYAPEIAQAMLRRQQATAIVAARLKIVEGAVGMVENALEMLSKKEIVDLDEEKKAAMVSNLMVVLCGDRDASPVINTGTLHQ